MALTDARQRVADQVKNLTRFIYLFGRISNGIEVTAETALQDKTGASREQATEVVRRNKQALVENLRNVRGGLLDLESRFRTNTQLRRFSPQMNGLSDRIAEAESQVTDGQLDQAGRSVIDVISRLTDALLIMR